MAGDSYLKCQFVNEELLIYWIKLYPEYPEVTERTIKILISL